MKNIISNKVNNIEISGIRKFYNKLSSYPNAISLTLGQPDFNVPNGIKEGLLKAIEENKTTYTSNAGIVELREEISNYLEEMNIHYSKEEICLTIGGSEALMDVFITLLNEGDKVLIPTPAYPAYESCVKLCGGEIINYELNEDFSINFTSLKEVIEKNKPKAMVVSYPSNPTGAVLSKTEVEELFNIVKDKEIILITDEIYSALTFKEDYYSIAQFKEIREKVILVSGFSKMFSMTGLRLGYVCASKYLINAIIKVHQYNVSCAPSIVQWAVLEGLRTSREDIRFMKESFIERRDYLYERLVGMGFEVNKPEGAFYMFPSIKKFNSLSEEFCEKILKEAGVAIVPGAAFGRGGEGYMRISYAYSMEELEECCNRLERFLTTNYK